MIERWRPVRGYEGAYEVSSLGRIRSLSRVLTDGKRWKGRIRKLKRSRSGHLHIRLVLSGKFLLVHRLVLDAFSGPCPLGMEACHANGTPDDNRIENLRWDTKKANASDRTAHGRTYRGARNARSKLCAGDVERIRDLNRCGVAGYEIAERFGVTAANVSSILTRKTWNHAS